MNNETCPEQEARSFLSAEGLFEKKQIWEDWQEFDRQERFSFRVWPGKGLWELITRSSTRPEFKKRAIAVALVPNRALLPANLWRPEAAYSETPLVEGDGLIAALDETLQRFTAELVIRYSSMTSAIASKSNSDMIKNYNLIIRDLLACLNPSDSLADRLFSAYNFNDPYIADFMGAVPDPLRYFFADHRLSEAWKIRADSKMRSILVALPVNEEFTYKAMVSYATNIKAQVNSCHGQGLITGPCYGKELFASQIEFLLDFPAGTYNRHGIFCMNLDGLRIAKFLCEDEYRDLRYRFALRLMDPQEKFRIVCDEDEKFIKLFSEEFGNSPEILAGILGVRLRTDAHKQCQIAFEAECAQKEAVKQVEREGFFAQME